MGNRKSFDEGNPIQNNPEKIAQMEAERKAKEAEAKNKMKSEIAKQYGVLKDRPGRRSVISADNEPAPEMLQTPSMQEQEQQQEVPVRPQNSPVRPQNSPVRPDTSNKPNLLLDELMSEFGIISLPKHETKIGSKKWTLRTMNSDLVIMARNMVDHLTASYSERLSMTKFAVAACCVSMIDDIPLYKYFNVETVLPNGNEVSIDDPHYPPSHIARQAALDFLDFLLYRAKDTLAEKIFQTNREYLDKYGNLEADIDKVMQARIQYTCPVPECTLIYEDGEGKNLFCKIHGEKMVEEENPMVE